MKPKVHIDHNAMSEIFYYRDGVLYNKITRGPNARKDQIAGSITNRGYYRVSMGGKGYLVHRIIYAILNSGIDDGLSVDHINGITTDNRVENLRAVTHKQNMMNRPKPLKSNSLGALGVSPEGGNRKKKYRAQIGLDKQTIYLGSFATIEEASAAYQAARKEYFGEFA